MAVTLLKYKCCSFLIKIMSMGGGGGVLPSVAQLYAPLHPAHTLTKAVRSFMQLEWS